MWNILNFEISRMVNSRPKRHKVRREDFSATIDYVIFIIRGYPLYTYSMIFVLLLMIFMIYFNILTYLWKIFKGWCFCQVDILSTFSKVEILSRYVFCPWLCFVQVGVLSVYNLKVLIIFLKKNEFDLNIKTSIT